MILDNLEHDTRALFVVDSVESNEECFETYGEAVDFYNELVNDKHELPRIRVCLVNNAYVDEYNGKRGINYDDRSDTFTALLNIK